MGGGPAGDGGGGGGGESCGAVTVSACAPAAAVTTGDDDGHKTDWTPNQKRQFSAAAGTRKQKNFFKVQDEFRRPLGFGSHRMRAGSLTPSDGPLRGIVGFGVLFPSSVGADRGGRDVAPAGTRMAYNVRGK